MTWRNAIGIGMVGMTVCGAAWAAESESPRHQWEIGPEVYYFRYKEPDVAVKFDGPMYGLVGSYTYRHANRLALQADGRGAWGLVSYTGSGTLDDIQDWTFEGRATIGYDLPAQDDRRRLTPFFGVGYRYLNDDSSGKTTSTGAVGYERESNYLYSPIGLTFTAPLGASGWTVGVSGEYDLFWRGWQISHLEDADPSFNTVENTQRHGHGARGRLLFEKTGERVTWVIAPFIRWWSIKDSENANITFSGTIVGYGYEPKNDTIEAGATISARF
ncbi:MAG: hypothetical protein HY600_03935 [Candidatus Omnitrophica bacterium]|nr:hypothetical protein [Candidatus Omnitrophota bacterium]